MGEKMNLTEYLNFPELITEVDDSTIAETMNIESEKVKESNEYVVDKEYDFSWNFDI